MKLMGSLCLLQLRGLVHTCPAYVSARLPFYSPDALLLYLTFTLCFTFCKCCAGPLELLTDCFTSPRALDLSAIVMLIMCALPVAANIVTDVWYCTECFLVIAFNDSIMLFVISGPTVTFLLAPAAAIVRSNSQDSAFVLRVKPKSLVVITAIAAR